MFINFIYEEGKLPGHFKDLYLRFNHISCLEELLQLLPEDELEVGKENMTCETFRKDILSKARDIHFDYNSINKPAREVLEAAGVNQSGAL